jgi:chemotaxis protein methyltransferase CheR
MNAPDNVPAILLDAAREAVRLGTGIVIDGGKAVDLANALGDRMKLNRMDPMAYMRLMKEDYQELILLASAVTIQETRFYRDKSHYDRLRFQVIPELIARKTREGRKEIAILSAGCATGEEPYTIGMILHEHLGNAEDWTVRITAADINRNALDLARACRFSEYKMKNLDGRYIREYFSRQDSGGSEISYRIKDSIRKMVSFRQSNLTREPFELSDLANLDVIFCENVIIYFSVESIQRLVGNFHNLLRDGGYLFTGYSETLNFIKQDFEASWWDGSYAFQKTPRAEGSGAVGSAWTGKSGGTEGEILRGNNMNDLRVS